MITTSRAVVGCTAGRNPLQHCRSSAGCRRPAESLRACQVGFIIPLDWDRGQGLTARSGASMAVAAACFRAKLAEQPTPASERTARVLAGYRRTAGDRGRGQARPFSAADLAAVLATCHLPRRRGRGVESDQVAAARGRTDAVIAGLLFMGGMRRLEVAALRWADVAV